MNYTALNENREILLRRLKELLVERRNRGNAEGFIEWLANKSDFFTAPLILPGTKPDHVSETGISSYAIGGYAQRSLAFYESILTLEQFDRVLTVADGEEIPSDSVLLCSMTYALDCTNRFRLNEVTGMYEDSRDQYFPPPGIRRSQYILTRYFPLSTEEMFAMSFTLPGFGNEIDSLPERKRARLEEYLKKKGMLSMLSYLLHDVALDELAEKLAIGKYAATKAEE